MLFTWQGAVIAAAAVSFPIMYRTCRGALEQVDRNITDAARTLGMSEGKIFFKIMIPMARPGIAAATILSFARALGEFGATMMLAGNIPGKTQTMSIAIYTAMQGGDREKAYIWVAIVMAISLAVILLMNLWNDRQSRRNGAKKKMKLYVDIEKQLDDFKLMARFETDGEVFAILGASGCGKTMTLRCIAGIERPDRGVIRLGDRVLFDSDAGIDVPARKRRVGYLFQDYAPLPSYDCFRKHSLRMSFGGRH